MRTGSASRTFPHSGAVPSLKYRANINQSDDQHWTTTYGTNLMLIKPYYKGIRHYKYKICKNRIKYKNENTIYKT